MQGERRSYDWPPPRGKDLRTSWDAGWRGGRLPPPPQRHLTGRDAQDSPPLMRSAGSGSREVSYCAPCDSVKGLCEGFSHPCPLGLILKMASWCYWGPLHMHTSHETNNAAVVCRRVAGTAGMRVGLTASMQGCTGQHRILALAEGVPAHRRITAPASWRMAATVGSSS